MSVCGREKARARECVRCARVREKASERGRRDCPSEEKLRKGADCVDS